ncbi:MAG: hypothetical protein LUC36_06570 [Oscillospiraceae bacterium]|nr:hypothetical protein [Oscillospiraceae bacterium]
MTIDFYFGTRTGIYSGEVNEAGLPDGYGSFTTANSEGMEYTYTGDWVNGHWHGEGIEVWDNGQSYTGQFASDARSGEGTLTKSDGTIYEGSFVDDAFCGEGVIYFTDGTRLEGTFTDDATGYGTYYSSDGLRYSGSMTDGTITLVLLDDFFGDNERREQFVAFYKAFAFSDLYEYAQAYISAEAVSEQDSAYAIISAIEPVLDCNVVWSAVMDELDSSYSVRFEQASEISSSNSVVPTVTSSGSLSIQIGFRKSGWLFFDHYSFGVDGKEVKSGSVKSYKTTRTVISGNTIEEYCFVGYISDEVLESIGQGETVTLRFLNYDSQEYYDHTLTQSEIDALYCGMLIEGCCDTLSELIRDYRATYSVYD